jgi:hypothetical protein
MAIKEILVTIFCENGMMYSMAMFLRAAQRTAAISAGAL